MLFQKNAIPFWQEIIFTLALKCILLAVIGMFCYSFSRELKIDDRTVTTRMFSPAYADKV
jgi:hypothetical protein